MRSDGDMKSGVYFQNGRPWGWNFHLISTLVTYSENIYIDYIIIGPISAEHPNIVLN
jgi:hypothetical protein